VTDAERVRRLNENERLFANFNEAVRELDVRLGIDGESEHYLCECSDQDCTQRIALMPEEYAEARSNARWFFMIPGHRDPAHERIVRETDRYVLVEKTD
jgi:hypothetical protein